MFDLDPNSQSELLDILWCLVGRFRGTWGRDVYHSSVFTSVGGAMVSAVVRLYKCAAGALYPLIDWTRFRPPVTSKEQDRGTAPQLFRRMSPEGHNGPM